MKDERLRELERAAATGDLTAVVEHARLRARLGLPSPSDLTIGEPFPCALPAPVFADYVYYMARPYRFRPFPEPSAWWKSRTLRVDANGDLDHLLEFLLEPAQRDLEAVNEAHWRWSRTSQRGPREPERVVPAGEGWVVSYALTNREGRRSLTHALLNPKRGTLWWRNPEVRLDLSAVWIGAPPAAEGGGWVLWLGDESHLELTRTLRALLELDMRQSARLRKRLGGPCLTGERLTLSLLAELLREVRGIPAEALWLSVLPSGLLEVGPPGEALWAEVLEAEHDFPQLGRLHGWPDGEPQA